MNPALPFEIASKVFSSCSGSRPDESLPPSTSTTAPVDTSVLEEFLLLALSVGGSPRMDRLVVTAFHRSAIAFLESLPSSMSLSSCRLTALRALSTIYMSLALEEDDDDDEEEDNEEDNEEKDVVEEDDDLRAAKQQALAKQIEYLTKGMCARGSDPFCHDHNGPQRNAMHPTRSACARTRTTKRRFCSW